MYLSWHPKIHGQFPAGSHASEATKKRRVNPPRKEHNRVIAGIRIVNEHAIGGIKRFAALTHKFQNRKGQDDLFVLLASALWNFYLKTI